MWMVLLVLSLCVNAFFLLFVHSSWLVPGRPLSRTAWASQGDNGALTSHPAARSQNKSNKTLAGSENLAKRTKNGAEDVSRTRRRPSRSGEVSGRVERSAVRRRTPDEKPVAAGGDLEPLRLLTNRSSSYITDAELGLPRSWRQNPNNTARVRYVLGTIQVWKLKVWNIGIEGMGYVSGFNLKMPSGMHVIVKDVLVITYLL